MIHLGYVPYLAWLKVDALNLTSPSKFFEDHGVGLSDGGAFGDSHYLRLNFGCPQSRLIEALEKMQQALIKEGIIGNEH